MNFEATLPVDELNRRFKEETGMKKLVLALSLTLGTLAFAQTPDLTGDTLKCGGFVDKETLQFKYNPISQMYGAITDDYNFWVYIRPLTNNRVDIALTKSIEPEFRNQVIDFMNRSNLAKLNYVAQAETQSFIVGLTDNYVHFYFEQGPRKISFSCIKK